MKNWRKVAKRLSAYFVVFQAIKEGYRLGDKIVLFLSIFNSLAYYLLNRIRKRPMRLSYYLLRHCLVKNHLGVFYCRASTNDALIVSETHEFKLRQYFNELREGNFVDIGAHIGKYTIQVARQLQDSGGRVISIEAHPENFAALVNNVKLNRLSNVTALNVACWCKNNMIRLYRDSNTTATSAYSAVRKFQGDCIRIDGRKLDDILKELGIETVDLMKLDVEGAEPQCLKGAGEFLKGSKVRKILFECANGPEKEECKSILEQYEYSLKHAGMSYYLAEAKRASR